MKIKKLRLACIIVFNISGGNNQILSNATKAEQNFYGDKYIEEMMKAKTKSQESAISPESTRLSLHINNVEALAEYVAKLSYLCLHRLWG